MAGVLPADLPVDWTVADMLKHFDIPPERLRLHPTPGTATEEDVFDVHRRTGRLCELVDGVLVEKTVGYYESVLAAILLHRLHAYLEEHPLGVEILSEGYTEAEMKRKLQEYFQGGSRLVWYIDPRSRSARAYTSPEHFTTVSEDGVLAGGDVLPGFQLCLGDLFAGATPSPRPLSTT